MSGIKKSDGTLRKLNSGEMKKPSDVKYSAHLKILMTSDQSYTAYKAKR